MCFTQIILSNNQTKGVLSLSLNTAQQGSFDSNDNLFKACYEAAKNEQLLLPSKLLHLIFI